MLDTDYLRAAVVADPFGNDPRYIYVDTLLEAGQDAYAEFVRLSVETADYSVEPCLNPLRTTLYDVGSPGSFVTKTPCHTCERCLKRRRVYELWREGAFPQEYAGSYKIRADVSELPGGNRSLIDPPATTFYVWRGFIECIRCSSAYWLENAEKLVAREPLRIVQLTDLPPYQVEEEHKKKLIAVYRGHTESLEVLGVRPIKTYPNWVNKATLKPIQIILQAKWSPIEFRFW